MLAKVVLGGDRLHEVSEVQGAMRAGALLCVGTHERTTVHTIGASTNCSINRSSQGSSPK